MPVYNGGTLVAEAIESVLAQSFTDFELIISDGGSTDDTPNICQRFADRDPRIRLFRHDVNRGAAWNFNFTFREACGEYFKWAAHDDVIAPTFIEKCVNVLGECPEVAWVMSKYARIDSDGNRLPNGPTRDVDEPGATVTREAPSVSRRFRAMLTRNVGNGGIFGLIRTDIMRKTALHRAEYGADKVFIAEVSLYGRMHQIPEVLFLARHHAQASGAMKSAAQLQHFMDPSRNHRFAFTRLRLLAGHLDSVNRAPLNLAQRVGCYGAIGLYLLQLRKWGQVVGKTVSGKGTGGGYAQTVGRVQQGAT